MKKIIPLLAAFSAFFACEETNLKPVDDISIAPQKNVFSAKGGTAEVAVQSSGEWILEGEYDWVEPSVRNGGDGVTVVFTASANEETAQKEAEFIFRMGEASATLELKIKGADEASDELLLSSKEASVDAWGGAVTVEVKSSVDWTLTGTCEWASPSVSSGKDGDIVTFTVDPNETGTERTFTFKFTAGDAEAEFKVISLGEAGEKPTVEISLGEVYEKTYVAEKLELEVKTNAPYRSLKVEIPDEAKNWLVHSTNLEGDNENTVIVCLQVMANSVEADREATIKVSFGSASDELKIKQYRRSQLEIDIPIVEVAGDAEKFGIPLVHNVEFDVEGLPDWMTFDSEGEDGTLYYQITNTDTKREAKIKYTEKNPPLQEQPLSVEITVIQYPPTLVSMAADFSSSRAYASKWTNPSVLTNLKSFTVEGLFNADRLSEVVDGYVTLFGIKGQFDIHINESGDYFEVEYTYPASTTSGKVTRLLNMYDAGIQIGQWYHFAAIYDDDARKMYCYLHTGENFKTRYEKSRKTTSSKTADMTFAVPYVEEEAEGQRNFWLGYAVSPDHCFDGRMAEVRIWNKVLTLEEIEKDNHMFEVDPASEGLVAYWKMDDGEGSIIKDHTANGNHLTGQVNVDTNPQTGFLWKPVTHIP